MKSKLILVLLFAGIISIVFFHQILKGWMPFPGDLLVGNQEPYKSYSYQGFAPGAVPNKAQGPDVIKQLVPWKKFAIDSFKKNQIPFWDPYNFSGNPLMANFQSGVFYPLNVIFLTLSFPSAWTIYIVLTPILSIFFMYLFLDRLKLKPAASLLGGISFSFCLYMGVWMEYGNIGHTLLWLPLILFLVDRFIDKPTRLDFLGIVISCLLSILAGYIQGVFYIYAVVVIYYFAKSISLKKIDRKKSLFFLLALLFPVLIALPQILPTLGLFVYSTRGNYTLDQIQKNLNPIYYLITTIIPDFFGNPASRNFWFNGTYIERVSYFGLIPFVFAIFAISTLYKKIEVRIFSILFVFTLLISTDIFVTRFFYLIPIPVISTTVATRILSIFSFSGAVLAAYGFNHLLDLKDKKKFYIISSIAFIFIAGLFVYVNIYPKISNNANLINDFQTSKRNIIIPMATIILLMLSTFALFLKNFSKRNYKSYLYIILILVISSFELFYYFQKITPFSPKEFLYPQTPVTKFLKEEAGINRAWGYGSAYMESNFQTFDNTYSTEGNDPLHIKSYTELLAASKDGKIPNMLPRPDANIAPGFGKSDLVSNLYRKKVLDITGVKYIINKDESINGKFNPDYTTFPEDKYKLVWQEGYWQAYENLNATPRFFVTNNYQVIDGNKVLEKIFDKTFDEKRQIVLSSNPGIKSGVSSGSARLVFYSPNKIIIDTNSKVPALLFLSDNFYPDWSASVNGKEAKVFLADYTFRAVPVSKGSSRVIFEFKAKKFYYGLYISIASIFMLLVTLLAMNKYEK